MLNTILALSFKRVILVCKKHFSGWTEMILTETANESMGTLETTNLGSQNLKIESAR